jgi:hypothetical protein
MGYGQGWSAPQFGGNAAGGGKPTPVPLIKTVRVPASIAPSDTEDVTVVFATPFADTNYTFSASVFDQTAPTPSLTCSVLGVTDLIASQMQVSVMNPDAGATHDVIVEVIAIHD